MGRGREGGRGGGRKEGAEGLEEGGGISKERGVRRGGAGRGRGECKRAGGIQSIIFIQSDIF